MRFLVNWVQALADFVVPARVKRRESHERRSIGAKRGWEKRKAKREVPNDIQ